MKRLSKVILIVLGTLVVLAALAVGGLLAYVQGDRGRAELEAALGRALKVPVKFRKVAIELPSRLRVEGITTEETGSASQPKITAGELHGSLALQPLLSGDLEIRDVVLEQPSFDWPQNAEGRWVWPSPEKVAKESKEPKPDEPKVEKPKAPTVTERKERVLIRGVKVHRGAITLRNAQGQPELVAMELNADFSEINEEQLRGVLSASRLVWGEKFAVENLHAALSYTNGVLLLDGIEAEGFNGTLKGRYEMDTRKEGQPFKTHLELRRVDLNALTTTAGWGDGDLSGRLNGEVDLVGRTDQLARLEGPGKLAIEDGRFRTPEFFGVIADVLQLSELANLRPKEATAEFKLRDEKVFVEKMVVATDNLQLGAHGVARFDGKLALDSQLIVTDRIARTLPEFARGSFTKLEDGRMGLDFKISGKTDKPKTDLAEKLLGGKVQDKVSDLLGSLFGNKPSKKPDDKAERKEAGKNEPKPLVPNQ